MIAIMPDGAVTTFVYDKNDRLVLTKPPVGGSTVRTFKEDRLHAVISPDGGVTSFDYNENGLISEVRDNAGNISTLSYDKDFNLSKMQLPNKAIATWMYDAWGRCHKTKNATGHEQNFIYDDLDRLKQVVEADNNAVQLKYNAYDEVTELHQKNGKVKFEYTPMGSLKMREERGRKVFFNYDTEEQLRYIDNEHGERYRFKRNPNGEIITETGFDGLTRMYQRDRAGKVYRVNRPGGKFTEYEYDTNGRITRAEHSDGTWETYSYDRNGNLIEAVNENSTVQLIRDKAGRVIAENQDGHLVESAYDNLGNRIQITSSLGAEIDLLRNRLGQIEAMNAQVNDIQSEEKTGATKNAQAWRADFAYNSIGMEVERLLPGGIVSQMKYDEAGRPIQQKVTRGSSEMRHRTYNWSANDRLTRMVDELNKGQVSYTHDAFGNLASAKYENNDMDYKLPDEVGNLYRSRNKGDRKYGAGGQLLKDGNTSFKYDDEGNLIEKRTPDGDEAYEWYGNGMLQAVTKTNGERVEFEYDALGRRTAKKTMPLRAQSRSGITRFVWDGNIPLHEWKYPLKDRPEWVVDEWGMLSKDKEEPIDNLVTWVFDEATFKPTAKIIDGEQFSIITDYLGTPVEMYNAQGKKTWAVEYDIYGKVRKLVEGSLEDCPFRYQGQYEDSETGLYYNRFRYYSADEGVYISQDPIGLAGGMPNMYSYTHDSNAWVDQYGLYSDLLGSGMGHHLMPRSIAKSLGIGELSPDNAFSWYPNNGANTADLHKQLHRDLIDEGIPYHGSKFKGTSDEFFEAAKKAYKDIDVKGYMKIPGTDNKLLKNVTPLEGIEKLQELHKKGKIPCK
ncbi:RHS repeat domain-containing protein [Zobellia roscoffensis]|uniref:RHS repeat domain-containing protein n=1 Tax=Zobellia roscoffensis TaxID=2779508 RepID=UPI00188C714D|nr:RHS repeat-associated core domain-containing protein [Zobellia roscoffensis]